jgi:IS30 family transposase
MSQLTAAERGKIEILSQQHYTNKQIAKEIGCHPSTIGREMAKGLDIEGNYRADLAHRVYQLNRTNCRATRKLNRYPELAKMVKRYLKLGYDPDQIAGRMRLLELKPRVCRETIYAWIYEDQTNQQESLYQYLKFGKKKRGRHRSYERTRQQFKMKNRVSIHDRPSQVEDRSRFGDWEGDTVVYPHKRVVVSLYERISGLVRFSKLPTKSSELVCATIGQLLKQTLIPITLTLDNGPEFHRHHIITNLSGAKVFFADIYASHQRGGNEQMNRQLRRYLPRGYPIDDLTAYELKDIEDELNNKPRQRLGYRTPNEVYRHILKYYNEVQTKGLKLDMVAFDFGV